MKQNDPGDDALTELFPHNIYEEITTSVTEHLNQDLDFKLEPNVKELCNSVGEENATAVILVDDISEVVEENASATILVDKISHQVREENASGSILVDDISEVVEENASATILVDDSSEVGEENASGSIFVDDISMQVGEKNVSPEILVDEINEQLGEKNSSTAILDDDISESKVNYRLRVRKRMENGLQDEEKCSKVKNKSKRRKLKATKLKRKIEKSKEKKSMNAESIVDYKAPKYKLNAISKSPACENQPETKTKSENIIKSKRMEVLKKLDKENLNVADSPVYQCMYCNSSVQRLKRHILTQHPDKVQEYNMISKQFKYCDKGLSSKSEMDIHVIEVHAGGDGDEHLVCDVCAAVLNTSAAFAVHQRAHLTEVQCTADGCMQVFRSKPKLREHLLIVHRQHFNYSKHTRQKDLLCTECGKVFSTTQGLNKHLYFSHSIGSVEIFRCKICGLSLGSLSSLKHHEQLHGPPTVPCPECGKLFHTHHYMYRHIKSNHVEDKYQKFKCAQCGKGFCSEIKLSNHINTHTGEKPYQCEWCERAYQNMSNLIAHAKKTHPELFQDHRKRKSRYIDKSSITTSEKES